MRIIFLFVCLALCSCERSPQPNPGGDKAKLISTDETRRVGMHVLLNRYPQAEIVSERNDGSISTYRFSTNGTVLPMAVVVDRKTSKARFESVKP